MSILHCTENHTHWYFFSLVFSWQKQDSQHKTKALAKHSQVDTSQRKFVKQEFVSIQTCKGWPNGFTVNSQVAKSRKFHVHNWLMCFYNNRLLAINLCRLVLGGQMVKNLHLLASKFELEQSQRKSTQVDASGWPNETQVQNLCWLVSPFGQGLKSKIKVKMAELRQFS